MKRRETMLLLANLKRINNSLVRITTCLALIAKSNTPTSEKEIHNLLNAFINGTMQQLAPSDNTSKKP